MVSRIACVVIFFLTSLTISETVVGTSNPFTFSKAIGIKDGKLSLNSFVHLQSKTMMNGTVIFSWSMQTKVKTGALSVYSLSGRQLKSIPLSTTNGLYKLDAKKEGLSNGIYFANLKVGTLNQKVKFTIL